MSLNYRLGLDKQGNVKNFIPIKEKINVRTMLGVRFFVLSVSDNNSYFIISREIISFNTEEEFPLKSINMDLWCSCFIVDSETLCFCTCSLIFVRWNFPSVFEYIVKKNLTRYCFVLSKSLYPTNLVKSRFYW